MNAPGLYYILPYLSWFKLHNPKHIYRFVTHGMAGPLVPVELKIPIGLNEGVRLQAGVNQCYSLCVIVVVKTLPFHLLHEVHSTYKYKGPYKRWASIPLVYNIRGRQASTLWIPSVSYIWDPPDQLRYVYFRFSTWPLCILSSFGIT